MALILLGIQERTAAGAKYGGEILELTERACSAKGLCDGPMECGPPTTRQQYGRRGLQPAVTQDHRCASHVPPGRPRA